MKILRATAILTLFIVSDGNSQSFSGFDTFNNASKNTTLWSANVNVGSPAFVPMGGKLYYTVPGTPTLGSATDYVLWPWSIPAPINTNWTAQVDVNVPVTMTPLVGYDGYGQLFGCALVLYKDGASMLRTAFYLTLIARYQDANVTLHQFGNSYTNSSPATFLRYFTNADSVNASLRLRWVAATKTIYAEFDPDGPANGYSWITFQSFTNPWNIASGGTLKVAIEGASHGLNITTNHQIYLQNFVASVGSNAPIVPSLREGAFLSWKSFPNIIQQVQFSSNMTSWSNLGSPIIGNGQTNTFFDTDPISSKRFYRVSAQ